MKSESSPKLGDWEAAVEADGKGRYRVAVVVGWRSAASNDGLEVRIPEPMFTWGPWVDVAVPASDKTSTPEAVLPFVTAAACRAAEDVERKVAWERLAYVPMTRSGNIVEARALEPPKQWTMNDVREWPATQLLCDIESVMPRALAERAGLVGTRVDDRTLGIIERILMAQADQ
jgi:hypothetical protein